jgi:hypothetical protein
MSLYDYRRSQALYVADEPFYGLIMAAMRRADTDNLELLRRAFPETHAELHARYHAPGGLLPGEDIP